MTRRKKMVWTGIGGAVVLVVALGFFMNVSAFGPGPFHGCRSHGMPGFAKEEMGEFMIWRLDRVAGKLDLTTKQQQKYEEFKAQLQMTMEEGMAVRMTMRQKVQAALEQADPDLSIVLADAKDHFDRMSAQVSKDLELLEQFYASLDPEQKSQIADRIKEKAAARKKQCASLR